MGSDFPDLLSLYAAMEVRHCWISLSSSILITQLPLLLQVDVNLPITINSSQLLHVYSSLSN